MAGAGTPRSDASLRDLFERDALALIDVLVNRAVESGGGGGSDAIAVPAPWGGDSWAK